jgi:hypothetical protein
MRWTKSETGGIKTKQFSVPDLVRYPTFDGREVPAWIHRPAGEGPHPVIIRIHGGPEGQARPVFTWRTGRPGKTRLYDHLPDVGCKARSGRHPAECSWL